MAPFADTKRPLLLHVSLYESGNSKRGARIHATSRRSDQLAQVRSQMVRLDNSGILQVVMACG